MLEVDTDRCAIPHCRAEADLIYLGYGICTPHWNQLTKENAPPDALRMTLGIEARPEPPMENTDMSKKSEKRPSEPKPAKKQPKAKEEGLVVFAFRLTEAERDEIHKTAGPARASRFVRSIAVAAARDDVDAIKTLIRDARQAAQ